MTLKKKTITQDNLLVLSLSIILILGGISPLMINIAYGANTIVTTITSSTASSGSTTSSTTLSYTVTFAESMENFVIGDITVTGTANGGAPVASNFAGSGAVYTFDVVKGSSDGTVIVSIAAGVADQTGAGTEGNAASNTYTLTIDTTAPTVTITSSTASSNGSTKTTTLRYTATFSESVSDFVIGDITVTGTANGGAPVASNFAGSGAVYTFDVVGTNFGGTVSVVIASGVATDGGGNTNTVSNTYLITILSSRGGGCDGDCTPPTLGVDKNSRRLVQDGFAYNGQSVDVELFYTPYPLITVDIGKQNKAEFKIYENQGVDAVKHFSLAFGLGQDQIISQSKAMIEWDRDHEGIETITLTDPENALEGIKIETSSVYCDDEKNSQCLKIVIYHTFRESLDFNMVATDVWDQKRNAWQNYYNHGIEIVGESLNPPDIHYGIYQGHRHLLTETSKTTAVDEFGDSWTLDKSWARDYIPVSKKQDKATMAMSRTHSEFGRVQQWQTELAMEKLLEICPRCGEPFEGFEDSWSYEYSSKKHKLTDPQVLEKLSQQQIIAQKTLEKIQEKR